MKALLTLIILVINLYSIDTLSIAKIYDSILTKIFKSSSVSVYCDTREYTEILFRSNHIRLVDSAEDADIILQTKFDSRFDPKQIIFTNKYAILAKNPHAIGAFYWSKGRPQIVFIRQRLEKKGINIASELKKYIVESL